MGCPTLDDDRFGVRGAPAVTQNIESDPRSGEITGPEVVLIIRTRQGGGDGGEGVGHLDNRLDVASGRAPPPPPRGCTSWFPELEHDTM